MAPHTHGGRHARSAGFTMVELMITLVVFALIFVAVTAVFLSASHSKDRTSANLEATQTARATLDMVSRDLRSAGYQADQDYATPQPAIAYIDSMELIVAENQMPYPDGATGPVAPLAYAPTHSPNPAPLVGNQWTPPIRYRTGAELIRYTLDTNNDGVVDANDRATVAGLDAAATPNPNDYVLVRQVYGDSTGNVANSNGGVQERVALVRKPGGGVPPIYTVYMKGSSTAYDWSNGPVPAAQLNNIERVVVQITAASARPDTKGTFAQTTLRTTVSSMRNNPNIGATEYTVSGYVYNDLNQDRTFNGSDVGISSATVQLGPSFIAYTNSAGYFSFRVPAGTYTLKHTPAAGFGSYLSPDTFSVVVTSANLTYSFADTAKSGGFVTVNVWNDLNGNGSVDVGEATLSDIAVNIGGTAAYTDGYGNARIFAAVGAWTAMATVPDSMIATTANPISGLIANGGTASGAIGMQASPNGTVSGTVYQDNNKNGTQDSGESGIANVWVGVTTDGGVTVQGYAYTDATGNFKVSCPANDPPKTQAYTVYCVPPANTFPTTTTATGGVWVKRNNTSSGYSFGMATYQVITLNASRVLSLAASDLIENDAGKKGSPHEDQDLILGADAGGTDNISVWFNQYNASPLFNAAPDYTRNAPQSVMAMAVDTLDTSAPIARPDLVTGTKYTLNGNFFVWLDQNTSGNEGFFPLTYSTGLNYKTADNGDVQAVKTLDVIGGNMPDIIVGTKGATALTGSIEIWQNSNSASPTFTRAETYTTFGATSTTIGEVTGMQLADLDSDGLKDLIVSTRTGDYSGQVIFFKNMGKAAVGQRFSYRFALSFTTNTPTCLATTDVDQDGASDVIIGTRNSTSGGKIMYLRNYGAWTWSLVKVVTPPGLVMSIATADMGGTTGVNDLIVGWRATTSGYGGGVLIYYLDVHGIPDNGVDPSGGSIVNMVPAIANANFNYGSYPTGAATPYLTDLAVGVKASATTGSLVIFIR